MVNNPLSEFGDGAVQGTAGPGSQESVNQQTRCRPCVSSLQQFHSFTERQLLVGLAVRRTGVPGGHTPNLDTDGAQCSAGNPPITTVVTRTAHYYHTIRQAFAELAGNNSRTRSPGRLHQYTTGNGVIGTRPFIPGRSLSGVNYGYSDHVTTTPAYETTLDSSPVTIPLWR